MKVISLFLFFLFSINTFASGPEIKLLLHGNKNENPKTKFSVSKDPAIGMKISITGLERYREGRVNYNYDLRGKPRNPKNPRGIGGSGNARVTTISEQGVFQKGDEGIWDFKITITDVISGKTAVQEIKNVEVTK